MRFNPSLNFLGPFVAVEVDVLVGKWTSFLIERLRLDHLTLAIMRHEL